MSLISLLYLITYLFSLLFLVVLLNRMELGFESAVVFVLLLIFTATLFWLHLFALRAWKKTNQGQLAAIIKIRCHANSVAVGVTDVDLSARNFADALGCTPNAKRRIMHTTVGQQR